MNPAVLTEYRRLRGVYHSAKAALDAARVNVAFDAAAAQGLVALRVVADHDTYDASFVDTWDLSSGRRARIKKEILRRADDEGVWGVVALAKGPCGHLHETDSCWGFIGNEWRDSGYDVDFKRAALAAVGLS